MTLVGLFLISTTLVIAHGQSLPQLNFHFATPDYPGRVPETLDVHLDEELDHLLYGLMCRYEGNRFTVRIDPSDGVTKVIDDSLAMTNETEGAIRCMTSKKPERVGCEEPAFCALGNICTARLKAPCNRYKTFNRWMMTEHVDVSFDNEEGKIHVVKCFTKCVSVSALESDSQGRSGRLSYLAVILIVVGVVLAAILVVVLIVIYKLRDGGLMRKIERKRSVVTELVQ
ncbi:hypothetical protein Bpfe_019939 [Biomphalaria pfeifferi]|uniref:Uncharacterized protein n=1 Tax=Biomphalaria pfeifferi TaxID=112525 RepID=A0AAD8BAE0_BIOPF|nr:hypothetical protein Bpfe_019939 [Biomphalaria pfeifferi]